MKEVSLGYIRQLWALDCSRAAMDEKFHSNHTCFVIGSICQRSTAIAKSLARLADVADVYDTD